MLCIYVIIYLLLFKAVMKLSWENNQYIFVSTNTAMGNKVEQRTSRENLVIKTGLSCNCYRIFPLTGKNGNAYRITLLSSQDFPAVLSCSAMQFRILE